MHETAHLRHPLAVNERSAGPSRRCRYCGHPIRLYDHVGWVDVITPYLGGTYDMCEDERWALHRPQESAEEGRRRATDRRARSVRRARSGWFV